MRTAKGVIHRDLKPANVLVGEFGETVVIDWGLAKDLSEPSSDDVGASDVTRRPLGATVAGDVMGTPAYMPPEQARGEPVDARADVYALGAMLYHTLASEPPFVGKTVESILDAVLHDKPRPLAERTPEVPRDLITIIEKAMARDASERYPNAKELAEDLEKFQTGQLVGAHHYSRWELAWRWIQRHKAVSLAALVIATVGTIAIQRIVSAERVATAQRDAARSSRDDAEGLLDFMVVDLRERLSAVGRIDLLEPVAHKALEYYQRHDTDLAPTDRGRRVGELSELSRLSRGQGRTEEAIAEQQLAVDAAQRLADEEPGEPRWRTLVAQQHRLLAERFLAHGAFDAVARELRVSQVLLELPFAEDSDDARFGLASVHELRARLLYAQQDNDAGLVEAHVAMEIAQPNAARNADWHELVLHLHQTMNAIYDAQGAISQALAEARAELATASTAANREPQDPKWRREIAVAHEHVAMALVLRNEVTDGQREYQEAATIWAELAARDPGNFDWQMGVGNAHLNAAKVLDVQNKYAEALVEARSALPMIERLVAAAPGDVPLAETLARAHKTIGRMLSELGRNSEALPELDAERKIYDQLAATHRDATWEELRGSVRFLIANVQGRLGNDPAADRELADAEAIYEPLRAHYPTNTTIATDLGMALAEHGTVLLALHHPALAVDKLRRSASVMEGVQAAYPDLRDTYAYQCDLAHIYVELVNALNAAHDHAGARAASRLGFVVLDHASTLDAKGRDVRELRAQLDAAIR
jgi:tetratricopeptide (TPR) repeat protein